MLMLMLMVFVVRQCVGESGSRLIGLDSIEKNRTGLAGEREREVMGPEEMCCEKPVYHRQEMFLFRMITT